MPETLFKFNVRFSRILRQYGLIDLMKDVIDKAIETNFDELTLEEQSLLIDVERTISSQEDFRFIRNSSTNCIHAYIYNRQEFSILGHSGAKDPGDRFFMIDEVIW